jgi:hypothetical protein
LTSATTADAGLAEEGTTACHLYHKTRYNFCARFLAGPIGAGTTRPHDRFRVLENVRLKLPPPLAFGSLLVDVYWPDGSRVRVRLPFRP